MSQDPPRKIHKRILTIEQAEPFARLAFGLTPLAMGPVLQLWWLGDPLDSRQVRLSPWGEVIERASVTPLPIGRQLIIVQNVSVLGDCVWPALRRRGLAVVRIGRRRPAGLPSIERLSSVVESRPAVMIDVPRSFHGSI